MDSAATSQGQPGTHTARLRVGQDTPYPVDMVDVTMVATPPRGWGKLTGVVSELDCGGEERALAGATVRFEGRDLSAQVRAGGDGRYTYWTSVRGGLVYVTGQSQGEQTGYEYATVAYRVDDGTESWVARYDGAAGGGEVAWAVGVGPDGTGVFVTGQSQGGVSGSDYATVAYDPATGDQRWAHRYQGPANGDDVARALAVSADGARVYVTGDSLGDGAGLDYATLSYDTAG